MKSSIEITNAISAPETMAGASSGRVTRRTVVIGDAPRSTAASKHEVSMVCNRARNGITTNGMQKVVCARISGSNPGFRPIIRMKPMVATPSTTSGIINDALISQPASAEPARDIWSAARMNSTPMTVDRTIAMTATSSEVRVAEMIAGSWNTVPYQEKENPFHSSA